jgi:alanine dehydrogenase
VFIGDEEYAAAGVGLAEAGRVWSVPLVLRYKPPDPGDLRHLRPGRHTAALFHAEGDIDLLTALQGCGATAWSYEFVTEDGRFPLGRPGGWIAGVQAVLAGAHALQTAAERGVLLAAVDGAEKANVVVIGSGNVGAAAAGTAAVLGANVTVLTRSEASRADYLRRAPGGIRAVANSRDTLLARLAEADLVIGAILVSTYDSPPMITEADLALMRPGTVSVDATCGYGPGYLPTGGPLQSSGDPPRQVTGPAGQEVLPAERGLGQKISARPPRQSPVAHRTARRRLTQQGRRTRQAPPTAHDRGRLMADFPRDAARRLPTSTHGRWLCRIAGKTDIA